MSEWSNSLQKPLIDDSNGKNANSVDPKGVDPPNFDIEELKNLKNVGVSNENMSSFTHETDHKNPFPQFSYKDITAIAINSEGSIAYYGTIDGEIWIHEIDSHEKGSYPRKHEMAKSSQGKMEGDFEKDAQGDLDAQKKGRKNSKINDLVFSKNEKYLYCANDKGKLFRVGVHDKDWEFEDIDQSLKGINQIAISNDDKMLLTCSDDTSMKLYDLLKEKEYEENSKVKIPKFDFKFFIGYTLEIKSVTFTKDSSRFISASSDCYIKIWDVTKNSSPLNTYLTKTGPIKKILLTDNDTYLVLGTDEGFVSVWLFEDMTEYHNFYAHSHPIISLLSVSNSAYVISTSEDKTLKILNLRDKFEESSIDYADHGRTQNAEDNQDSNNHNYLPAIHQADQNNEFSPQANKISELDSYQVIVPSKENCIRRASVSLKDDKHGSLVQISKDSSFILVSFANEMKKLNIWNHDSKNIVTGNIKYFFDKKSFTLRGHDSHVSTLLSSPKEQRIISGSDDNSIIIWHLNKIEKRLTGHKDRVRCLVLSKDEKVLYSGSHDRDILSWQLNKNYTMDKIGSHESYVWCLSLFNDDSYLASGSADKSISIWKIETREKIMGYINSHKLPLTSLLVSENYNCMITTALDGRLKIWDLSELDNPNYSSNERLPSSILKLAEIEAEHLKVNTLVKISKYFKKEGIEKKSLKNPEPQCADFNSDKTKIVIGCRNASIYVMSMKQIAGKDKAIQCLVLLGHISWVRAVRFIDNMPGGVFYLVSVSYDKTLRIWKIENNKLVEKSVTEAHDEHIFDVCIAECAVAESKTNQKVSVCAITCSASSIIKGWELALEKKKNEGDEEQEHKSDFSHSTPIKCLRILENHSKVATGSEDGSLKFWSINEQQGTKVTFCKEYHKFDHSVTHIDVLNNDTLIVALKNGDIYSLDIKSCGEENYEANPFFELDSEVGALLCVNENLILCSKIDLNEIYLYQQKSSRASLISTYMVGITSIVKDNTQMKFLASANDKGIYRFEILSTKANSFMIFSERDKFAEDLEGITKICIVFENLLACALRDNTIALWRLDRNYKYRSFKGHTERVIGICSLDQSSYKNEFVSCSQDMTIRRWNIEQRRQVYEYTGHKNIINDVASFGENIFSISNDKTLRYWNNGHNDSKSISKFSSTIENFLFFSRMQKCKLPDVKLINAKFGKSNHTPLHYYMFHGYDKLVEEALNAGAEVFKNTKGRSPLFYALKDESELESSPGNTEAVQTIKDDTDKNINISQGNHEKCMDTFLSFMINLRNTDEEKFLINCCALEDDFVELILHTSPYVPEFFEQLLVTTIDTDLPVRTHSKFFPMVDINYEDLITRANIETLTPDNTARGSLVAIELKQLPFKLPMKVGTEQSVEMLRNLLNTENTAIYRTPIVQMIINEKWNSLWWYIFIMCMLHWVNFSTMCMLLFNKTSMTWAVLFFSSTSILFLIEFLQMIRGCKEYFSKFLNLIDLIRAGFSYSWLVLLMTYGVDNYQEITWLMVLMNIIRAISGFKCFGAFRYYIKLLSGAFRDTLSFIVLFSFSTLAFGILYLESSSENHTKGLFEVVWRTPYELSMGSFSTELEALPYITFMFASLINVVIMLNLLISILGDSYDKFQANAAEVDANAMIEMILELEEIALTSSNSDEKMFINIIDLMNIGHIKGWDGSFKEIEKNIKDSAKNFDSKIIKIEGQISDIHKILKDIQARLPSSSPALPSS